ncbi:hypothetical protein ACC705_35000, partial [Rhizobium ruizarguesonis]
MDDPLRQRCDKHGAQCAAIDLGARTVSRLRKMHPARLVENAGRILHIHGVDVRIFESDTSASARHKGGMLDMHVESG